MFLKNNLDDNFIYYDLRLSSGNFFFSSGKIVGILGWICLLETVNIMYRTSLNQSLQLDPLNQYSLTLSAIFL